VKIVILTTNFPRWKGDFRVPFIYEAARAIHAKGHTVRIITMHNPGAAEMETMDGMEVFRIRYLPEKFENLQQDAAGIPAAWERSWLNRLALLPYFFMFCWATAKYARGFDMIHANWSLSGLAALMTRFFHKAPYVVTVQGSDVFKTINKPIIKPFIKWSLKKASRIIALSNSLKSAVQEFGIPAEHVVVIPNGIDISQFPMGSLEARQAQILYVGSLIERKGVNYLLQAMLDLKHDFPQIKLLLVGEGDQKQYLEEFVRQNQLAECVQFLGAQSQAAVGEIMRSSKLLILPSIEEGQGVVLVEALASGTPCIGSNVGGIPDVITADVGCLFEAANVDGLKKCIKHLLEDEKTWRDTSQAARYRAEQYYDWNSLVNGIIKQYHLALLDIKKS